MSLIKFSNDYNQSGVTCVDNVFIHRYLCDVPDKYVKVYLYGLYLLNNSVTNSNSIDGMCRALNLLENEIFKAFQYFEEIGLVDIISKEPLMVEYAPVSGETSKPKKIKPGKYAEFSKHIQAMLPERNISTAEFLEYYNFLDTYNFPPEALITIISYCTLLKGKSVSYRYFLTVAKNWSARGINTLEACENELTNYNRLSQNLSEILTALGKKSYADYNDSQLYTKWTDLEFSKECILFVAKYLKKQNGTMQKLDDLLMQFYANKKMSVKEMTQYLADIQDLKNCAKSVVKDLSLFYSDLSPVIETYITPWTDLGFSFESLPEIAKFCFKCGIKTLEGMNQLIEKMFKLGTITTAQIKDYIRQNYERDKIILQILERLKLSRGILAFDRTNYEIWKNSWNIPNDLILYAATNCSEDLNSVKSMHLLLNAYKDNNISTIEQAKGFKFNPYQNFSNTNSGDKVNTELTALINNLNEKRHLAEKTAKLNLEIALKDKQFSDAQSRINELILQSAKHSLTTAGKNNYDEEIELLEKIKKDALKRLKIKSLEVEYQCKLCNDSGFINGAPCECLSGR
ncbi:MAG: DnaD domain protein [Firmicutes bacterium]|nr:DnaD domain protein [Bacillota bacterium]